MEYSDEFKEALTQEIDIAIRGSFTDNNHRILKDISSLGCSKKSMNAAAYRVYLDLCEVRKYEAVSYHYSKEMDLIYLKAAKKNDEMEEIIVPVLASKKVSFKEIEELQDVLNSNYVHVAICDSNTLVMYYKISKS